MNLLAPTYPYPTHTLLPVYSLTDAVLWKRWGVKRDEFVATFPAVVTIVFDYKNSKEMRNTWSRLIVITEPLSVELLVRWL